MAFTFDPNPDLDKALKRRFAAPMPFDQEAQDLRAFIDYQPKQAAPRPQPRPAPTAGRAAQSHQPIQETVARAKQGAQEFDRGVAAAVALTDGAKAEDELAQSMEFLTLAGNVAPAKPSVPVKPATAEPATASTELTPKRATNFYEAVQQMDPLGQAFIAGALGVPAEVFRTPEEMEIEKRNRDSVLRWRTAMDDPNSAERKALDGGDLQGFLKLAAAGQAVDPLSFVNTMAELRASDERRSDYGYDLDTYYSAMTPVVAGSVTLTNPSLAVGEDGEGLDKDGLPRTFDVMKVMMQAGAVDDVVRATATAAANDVLNTKSVRPYVMAANMRFFDDLTAGLASQLVVDDVTRTARFQSFDNDAWGEPTGEVAQNLAAYIKHQRVALVASRRYAPDAVKGMDDMQVLSIATGQPRLTAILDDEGNVVLGDAKAILEQQTLYAPEAYNAILSAVMPATTATGDGKPSGGAEKKPEPKGKK